MDVNMYINVSVNWGSQLDPQDQFQEFITLLKPLGKKPPYPQCPVRGKVQNQR